MTASSIVSQGAFAASSAVPVPSGVAPGSLVLVVLYGYWSGDRTAEVSGGAPAYSAPSGFTLGLQNAYYAPGQSHTLVRAVYWKRATGADSGTYSFTEASLGGQAGLGYSFGIGLRLVGPESGSPILAQTTSAQTLEQELTLTAPGMTPSQSEALLIAVLQIEPSDRPISSAPSGWDQVLLNVGGATGGRAAIYQRTQDTAAATGPLTWNFSDTVRSDVLVFAVAPATASVPLDTPTVTLDSVQAPSTAGGTDGTITVSWTPVSNATRYEVGIAEGEDATSFTQVDDDATSPYTVTGRASGSYTVGVRAHAS